MKILGTIRTVCDARTILYNGSTIVKYPIIFDFGSESIVGEMYASAETLKRRGVQNGAIGNMEIEFDVREAKKSNGDSYPAQRIKFKDFRLANAGIFNDNAPAASGSDEPAADPEPAPETPVEVPQEAKVDENGNPLPF